MILHFSHIKRQTYEKEEEQKDEKKKCFNLNINVKLLFLMITNHSTAALCSSCLICVSQTKENKQITKYYPKKKNK